MFQYELNEYEGIILFFWKTFFQDYDKYEMISFVKVVKLI